MTTIKPATRLAQSLYIRLDDAIAECKRLEADRAELVAFVRTIASENRRALGATADALLAKLGEGA